MVSLRSFLATLLLPLMTGVVVLAADPPVPERPNRWREGFDRSVRPVRTSPRHTLYPDDTIQVQASILPCGEEGSWCASVHRCFQGIHRVPCRCDARSLVDLDHPKARELHGHVMRNFSDPPETPILLRGTDAAATRELFSGCPLGRFHEASLLLDHDLVGTVKVEEPMPYLLPFSGEGFGPGILHRLSFTYLPGAGEKVQAVLDSGQFYRLKVDNLGTGVARFLVPQSENELTALEDEVLRGLAKTDPAPLSQNIPLEDQRRLCAALPLLEDPDSSRWTLFVQVAHEPNCDHPTSGLFAVVQQDGPGLKILYTVPASSDGSFALFPMMDVVDLLGDGHPDVVVAPADPFTPVAPGQGVFVNTGPGQWLFEQWRRGEAR